MQRILNAGRGNAENMLDPGRENSMALRYRPRYTLVITDDLSNPLAIKFALDNKIPCYPSAVL